MICKPRGKKGTFSFTYYDDKQKKNCRLRAEEVPSYIKTQEQGDAFCRQWDAERDAAKVRIQRSLAWQTEFSDFKELCDLHEVERKQQAPCSWQDELPFLKHYVFRFFLTEKNLRNITLWPEYFDEFKSWLQRVEPIKKKPGQKTLAYASMNRCITVLNTFLDNIAMKKKTPKQQGCKFFPKELLKSKGVEAYIASEDLARITAELEKVDLACAEGFYVCTQTGLRENELFGLPMGWVTSGMPQDPKTKKMFEKNGINCYGFVTLRSQPALEKIRDADGKVPRKPLKNRKKIDPIYYRTIPITDKKAWNIIARRFNEQAELYKTTKVHGNDTSHYLLFEGLSKNTFYNRVVAASAAAGAGHHSPHDARHTYCTNLAELSPDFTLCKLITGHSKSEMFERYNHLFALIQQDTQLDDQIATGMQAVD